MSASEKKLRKIHNLCMEFAEMLRKLPFDNKIDEAKARSFLSGIRDVLGARNVDLEVPRKPGTEFWEPDKTGPMDPEKQRKGIEEAHRIMREGTSDDD